MTQRIPAGRLHFLLKVIFILAAIHAYIGWRLLPALPIGVTGWIIGIALLVASTVLLPMGLLARFVLARETDADKVSWVGYLAMGYFSSLLVLTLLRDVVLVFVASAAFVGESAIAVPLLALLVTVIGFINARRVPQIVHIDIPLHGLHRSLHGFTIVQISDLHIGPTIKGDRVQAIVDRVNTLNADLIAVTGDLVDGSIAHLAEHVAPLGNMASRHGSFVVTGNHEYYSGASEWMAEYQRIGLRSLMNEHVVLEHDGARLIIAGVADYSAHQFDESHRSDPRRALVSSPDDAHKILLAHQPRSANAAAEAGFDLQLSGHTHGGQFWPWPLFVRLQQPYTAGLHRLDKLWVYTSRGSGYWGPPKRFGAPAEITRIRLVAAT
jgi:uncharacterized protein